MGRAVSFFDRYVKNEDDTTLDQVTHQLTHHKLVLLEKMIKVDYHWRKRCYQFSNITSEKRFAIQRGVHYLSSPFSLKPTFGNDGGLGSSWTVNTRQV